MAGEHDSSETASRARVVATVVVGLLVAFSGVGVGAELSKSDAQVVESPASDRAQRATQPPFPPGTNETGIANATALLQAHYSALQNTTYSARSTGEEVTFVSSANQSGGEWKVNPFTIAVEEGQAGTRTRVVARGDRTEYWVTENATATRSAHSQQNSTTVFYWYREDGTYGQLGHASRGIRPAATLVPYLEAVDYAYRGTVTRGNDTLHRFVSTGIEQSADSAMSSQFSSTGENVSARLLVSERGVIRQFNATVEYARENETVTARVNYSVDGIGETTTSEPAWLNEELPRVDASVIENGRVLALQYAGGYDPTNGTQPSVGVIVQSPNVNSDISVATPLSPGDTVYLWSTNRTGKLASSVNDPPSVNESFVAFGGERVALSVSRFQVTSHQSATTNSYSTIELWVLNETATQNETLAGTAARNGTLAE